MGRGARAESPRIVAHELGLEKTQAEPFVRYLAAVSSADSASSAMEAALELAAEIFDAQAGAILSGGTVAASVGLPADHLPVRALREAADKGGQIELAGAGSCHAVGVPVDDEGREWTMVLVRAGDPFSSDEADLLAAMGSLLSLCLGNQRTMSALRERQVLFERLSTIQRLISTRAPLGEVFDVITSAVCELLGDPLASLYLLDPVQGGSLMAASVQGAALSPLLSRARLWVGQGVTGRSVADDRLTVAEGRTILPAGAEHGAEEGVEATMAAPVHDGARVVGCLVVRSLTEGRTYRRSERELLVTFAELASLAVTDARVVEELHEALGSANYRAQHDPLTGLANRARFLDRLRHGLAKRQPRGPAVAVLYLDIDDFKLVNDRYGHGAGDKVLVEVAGRLGAAVRGGDTVARLGGDEFAVLLESTSSRGEAALVAERILDALALPVDLGDRDVSAMASIGLAVESSTECTADELLRRADLAMYRAKHAGKGRVVVFEEERRGAAC